MSLVFHMASMINKLSGGAPIACIVSHIYLHKNLSCQDQSTLASGCWMMNQNQSNQKIIIENNLLKFSSGVHENKNHGLATQVDPE